MEMERDKYRNHRDELASIAGVKVNNVMNEHMNRSENDESQNEYLKDGEDDISVISDVVGERDYQMFHQNETTVRPVIQT